MVEVEEFAEVEVLVELKVPSSTLQHYYEVQIISGLTLHLVRYVYGSFPLAGTIQYSTVRYAIRSVSIIRSCKWYQNSKLQVLLFWGTSVRVPTVAQ